MKTQKCGKGAQIFIKVMYPFLYVFRSNSVNGTQPLVNQSWYQGLLGLWWTLHYPWHQGLLGLLWLLKCNILGTRICSIFSEWYTTLDGKPILVPRFVRTLVNVTLPLASRFVRSSVIAKMQYPRYQDLFNLQWMVHYPWW